MTAQTLTAPSGECTEQDAAATSIVLIAYMLNNHRELERYYDWLIETSVLDDPDVPDFAEYKQHLATTLDYFVANYYEAGAVPENARMSSGVASGPSNAPRPGKEGGRHRERAGG